jgi:acyl dehydratase
MSGPRPLPVSEMRAHVGKDVGVSGWLPVTQEMIDRFADTTGDRQWIHVDRARAAAESPAKTTIAHGFLTLSLISQMLRDTVTPTGLRMAINCGLNRVRFIAPVPSDSRIRGRFTLAGIEDVEAGAAIQATWTATIERDGAEKPVCVAEWLVRYYPA